MDLLIDAEESGGASAISTRVDVFLLTEFDSNTVHAGKSHIGVPRRKVGTLNDCDDLENAVRKFASEPGTYYAEMRAGREVLDRGVFPVKPRAQNIELDSAPDGAPDGALVTVLEQLSNRLARLEHRRAQGVNAVRKRRRFQDDATTRDRELARSVAERPRSLPEQVDEALTVLRKVKAFEVENMPERDARRDNPESEADSETKTLTLLLKDRRVRERAVEGLTSLIGGETAPRTWLADAGDLIAEHGEKLVPIVASIAGMFAPKLVQAPMQPQPAHAPQARPHAQPTAAAAPPAPPAAPQTFESELAIVLENIASDIGQNRRPRKAAREFVSLMHDFPEQAAALEGILTRDTATILAVLAQQNPAFAAIMQQPNAAAFIDGMKQEVARVLAPKVEAAPMVVQTVEAVSGDEAAA
jgi:hypothetical protein